MTKKCIKNFCHNEKMYLSSSLIRCSCVWKPKVPCLSKAARFIEELVESRQSLIRFRHLLLYGSVMSRDLTNVLFFFFNIRVFTGIHDVANFFRCPAVSSFWYVFSCVESQDNVILKHQSSDRQN